MTNTAARPATRPPASLAQNGYALEFPFKVGELGFLLHRVREGENFEVLEETYATTSEVILAINDSLSSPLWVNRVIVISPGAQVADPEIPAFQPYEVTDEELLLSDLAEKMDADLALLQYYNNCPDTCRLAAGDWVIIPHPRK